MLGGYAHGSAPLASSGETPAGAVAPLLCSVTGIAPSCVFGTPFVAGAVLCVAGSINTTVVGTPVHNPSPIVCTPASIASSVVLGQPYGATAGVQTIGAVSGFRSTSAGKPERLVTNYAPSASTGARFGQPKANTGRFTCVVEGIGPSLLVGLPFASGAYRAQAFGIPGGSVGTPQSQYVQYGTPFGISPSSRCGRPRTPLPFADVSISLLRRERSIYVRPQ